MTIDRMPRAVIEDRSGSGLVVYTGAPDAFHDGYGGGSYTYRFSRVDLPPGDLPPMLRIDDRHPSSIEENQIPGGAVGEEPATRALVPEDPRASWTLVELSPGQQQAAIEALSSEFANLDSFWEAPSGARTPLTDDLTGTRVDVVGEWPTTRIEVSFTYPYYPQGRLRRTYRVFDDAGRIKPTQYATIHLMEDLDTKDLPPIEDARNNILDI